MGAYVSVPTCESNYGIKIDCSVTWNNETNEFTQISNYTVGTFPSNSDIAGVGILGTFIAVTCFALFISIIDVLWQVSKVAGWKAVNISDEKQRKRNRISFSEILETLVLSCSDQQVFTGAAYALTLRYWNGCSVSAYHYNIVANMMLITCATHLTSVTIVRNYWRYPWLGMIRVICITGVFIFTGVLMVNQNAVQDTRFPTEVPRANETSSLMFMPAACFQSASSPFIATLKNTTDSAADFFVGTLVNSNPGNTIHGWNWFVLILIFYLVAVVAEFVRFLRRGRERPGWRSMVANKVSTFLSPHPRIRKICSYLFLLYLGGGIGISSAATVICGYYIYHLRRWVDKSGWIEQENNMNPENDATDFGQLVPIFMSAMIIFSFLQIVSEKVTEHNEHKHENDEEHAHHGANMPFMDPSKITLSMLHNTETAYEKVPMITPSTDDFGPEFSAVELQKSPPVHVTTVDAPASPSPETGHLVSPLDERRVSKESLSKSSTGTGSSPRQGHKLTRPALTCGQHHF